MKKRNIKSALLAVWLIVSCLLSVGCSGSGDITPDDIEQTQDKYRTYYQIFPYSFADSDGDGIGDIQGIIDKLDYIEDLNFDGIWLTPVHQSTTYHKYDVVDYYSIDEQFGTLEDYDRLVEECHKRGMTILLDLVFNHTSSECEWFEQCAYANMRGKTDNKYYNYYNFEKLESTADLKGGWEIYSGNWAYECPFWGEMPDLNLQNVLDEPDGALAQELTEIMRFWLIDHNIDGFRLDAVTSYFSGNEELNKEFLTWLNKTAKEIKPDCYIVGEGAWGNPAENQRYQESGVDSFFAFQNGYKADNNLSYSVRLGKAAYLYKIDQDNAEKAGQGIPAAFIANHDTGRAYGISMEAAQPGCLKEIYGLLAMSYGATFSYYGDEVGMALVMAGGTSSSYKDEDRRQPMPWGDSYQCKPVKGSTAAEDSEKYPLGTVAEQLEDEDSVLNYVRRANAIRRAFPQIARYVAQEVYTNTERDMCVVSKGEGAEKIYIVWNASQTTEHIYDTSELGDVTLAATLSVDGIPKLSGSKLTVPAKSFAILVAE